MEEMECEENVRSEILKSAHGMKTSDIIRDQLMNWNDDMFIDYIYVGNKGADFSSRNEKNYLGSVTAEVIKHTKLNVFFIP